MESEGDQVGQRMYVVQHALASSHMPVFLLLPEDLNQELVMV